MFGERCRLARSISTRGPAVSTRVVRFDARSEEGSWMSRTALLQERRMLKFRDVLSRWEASELSAFAASSCWECRSASFDAIGHALRIRERLACGIDGSAKLRRAGFPSAIGSGCWICIGRCIRAGTFGIFTIDCAAITVLVGLQLDEDAASGGGNGRAHRQTRSAPAQARAQAVRGNDAAPGRLARAVARGRAGAGSDRDDG
jgi:hypothetical protein